jgi:predicted SnoaL-like aldol condensation-catalyzing enzyme
MRRLFRCVLGLSLLAISTGAPAQVPVTPARPEAQAAMLKDADPALASNKTLVYNFWRIVLDAGQVDQVAYFMAPDYIQHNPSIPTGRQAFIDGLSKFVKPKPVRPTINGLVGVIADGDLVVLAFADERPDPARPGQKYTTTRFDMFRVEGGKVAEHWDTATKLTGPPPVN